jgi:hypothetical protein
MYKKLSISILVFLTFNLYSQVEDNYKISNIKNDYLLNYLNNDTFEDLRTSKSGDKAFTFMYLITYDDLGIDIGVDVDTSSFISSGADINRLSERFVPNFRYFLSEKSVFTFGIIYAKNRYNSSYKTDTSVVIVNNVDSETYSMRSSKLSFRVAYDYHYKITRTKLFDIDPYIGVSANIGNAPKVISSQTQYLADPSSPTISADYYNIDSKENYISLGGDLYLGVNFKFERFSLGAEMLAIGFDHQSGYGKRKVEVSQSVGGEVSSSEYYESIDNPVSLGGPAYSELNLSTTSSSMYRGLRLNFTYYIK